MANTHLQIYPPTQAVQAMSPIEDMAQSKEVVQLAQNHGLHMEVC